MAVREIKTTIALDGEQKFKQAIAAASREMRVMDSELKAVTAAYENNGDAAAYYAQKQAILKNEISQQKNLIASLEQAVEDATIAYGAGSSQVQGYTIQLNNARTRMSKLGKQLEETDREVEELGRDSIKAGRQLEQGIGEGAEEAERDVKSLIRTMQDDISSIRTSSAVSAITGLWNTATSAFDAVVGFVSGTADYRRQLSFLMQNAVESGLSGESVENQLIEVQGIIGESAAAMEGLNNLLQIGFDEPMFNRAMQGLLGAYAAFPETLGFGPLSESLQETLATGRATGQYAELLERLKIDIDDFNKALEESPNAIGDMEIALSYLEAEELDEAYKQYRKDNEDLIREMEAIAKIEFQSARLGEKVSKYLTTPIQEAWGNVLDWIADTIEVAEKEGLGAAASKVGGDLKNAADIAEDDMEDALSMVQSQIDEAVTKNVQAVLGALGLEVSAEDTQAAWENTKRAMLDSLGMFKEMTGKSGEVDLFGLSDTKYYEDPLGIQSVEDLEKLTGGKKKYTGFQAAANTGQKGAPTLEQQLTDFLMQDLDMSMFTPQEATSTSLLGKWKQEILDTQEALKEAEPDLKEAGEDAGNALVDGAETALGKLAGRAKIFGQDAGLYFGSGLLSQVSYVAMASAQLAAAAASRLTSGSAVSGLKRPTEIVLQVDGRSFARGILPYQDEAMAVNVE